MKPGRDAITLEEHRAVVGHVARQRDEARMEVARLRALLADRDDCWAGLLAEERELRGFNEFATDDVDELRGCFE